MAKIKKVYDNNTYSTIPGTASWPKIGEPDKTFNDDGEWVIKVIFDADNEDVKNMQKQIIAYNKEQPDYDKATAMYPWGPYKNDDKEVVEGKVCFKFKRRAIVKKDGKRVANQAPRVVDSAGVPWINCPLGGGSTVQVGYQMLPYTGFGKVGISLRLVSVRVLELKEYKVEVEWGDYTGSSKAPEVSTQAPVEDDIPVGDVDDDDDEF